MGLLRTLAIQASVCLVGLELACQGYFFFVLAPQFEETRADSQFYYQASDDPVLVYELAAGKRLVSGDRRLAINGRGIRDESDELFDHKIRLGILGDSVVFGIDLSQEQTLPDRLQVRLDPRTTHLKVLNLGVPGYGLGELPRWLDRTGRIYRPTDVVYLLNMNDFSRRDSVYEGADNGLYRTFRRPVLMLPLFVNKAIYRLYKGGGLVSVAWYRWLYDGNREWGLHRIDVMNEWARNAGSRFYVAILPAGIALRPDGYGLERERAEIERHLRSAGIRVIELRRYLAPDCFDDTDHFTVRGADRAAEAVAAQLGPEVGGRP
jgi:SAM-dependent methyltransferase